LNLIRNLLLLFVTVRYLKWQQIYFRLARKFLKPKETEKLQGSISSLSASWVDLSLYDEKINIKLEACFLSHNKILDFPSDWNNESPSKLWVYNLHYFEDLLSKNKQDKSEFHRSLLYRWIDENPFGHGNGWNSYPISLRIVNVLKAWLGGLELDKKIFSSIFSQANFLSNALERHLLGNHYFANLKALLFAGVIFKNEHWLEIGQKGLINEIPEQILEDGANFELSPMYHSLMLVDMLDIFNLSRAYPDKVSIKLVSLLEEYIPKMLFFMEASSHPDEGISFFNDSAHKIAPEKEIIERYAEELGFEVRSIDNSKTQIIDNVNSGLICVTVGGNKLMFDASPIGPDYIPGHAHADTLSFELSIGNERVFVNSGTSEYGTSSLRHNQRKTKSHNTVEVNGKDSSEVWGGFRVANRAKIVKRHSELKHDNEIVLEGAHNGYKSLLRGCIHSRKLILSTNSFYVADSLKGNFKSAISRFFVHPNLDVTLEKKILRIKGLSFSLTANTENILASIQDSFWYPEFGKRISNKVIEIKFESKTSKILFTMEKNKNQ